MILRLVPVIAVEKININNHPNRKQSPHLQIVRTDPKHVAILITLNAHFPTKEFKGGKNPQQTKPKTKHLCFKEEKRQTG